MLTVKREVISIHLIQSLKTSTGFGQDRIRAVYQHFTSGIFLKIVGFRMKQCIGVMNHCETIDSVDIVCGLAVNVHDRADSTHNIYDVYRLTIVHDYDTLCLSDANYFQDYDRYIMQ